MVKTTEVRQFLACAFIRLYTLHWHFDSRQLLHINTVCTTPEKMAIVLLDHLFSQETQAESNLSGKGKHFKKQLDPLKVHHNHIKTVYLITGSSSEMGRFSYCITGTLGIHSAGIFSCHVVLDKLEQRLRRKGILQKRRWCSTSFPSRVPIVRG